MKFVFATAAVVVASSLAAGPAPGYLEMMRSMRKSSPAPVSTAPDAVAKETVQKVDEKTPAVAAAAKPAAKFKLVTSGPPKNATTHLVYLDEPLAKPTAAMHAD